MYWDAQSEKHEKRKCCLVHFQPFNGEAQALMTSLYLVLESYLKSQKFQNSSPRLQYPTICPHHEKILGPWIFNLILCRFIDPDVNLAFLVKGYMSSLYTFCSTGRIVRDISYILHHLQLIFFCSILKHLYREYMQDDLAETLLSFIQWMAIEIFHGLSQSLRTYSKKVIQLGIVRFLLYFSSASIWKLSSHWTLRGLRSYTYVSLNFLSYYQRR